MALTERPLWRTIRVRAEDLVPGDVTRNSYGKWDVVDSIKLREDGRYATVHFEIGSTVQIRSVHLCDVQAVKPS